MMMMMRCIDAAAAAVAAAADAAAAAAAAADDDDDDTAENRPCNARATSEVARARAAFDYFPLSGLVRRSDLALPPLFGMVHVSLLL